MFWTEGKTSILGWKITMSYEGSMIRIWTRAGNMAVLILKRDIFCKYNPSQQ